MGRVFGRTRLMVVCVLVGAVLALGAAPVSADQAVDYHVNLRELSGCSEVPGYGTTCADLRGAIHATVNDRVWVHVNQQAVDVRILYENGTYQVSKESLHLTSVVDTVDFVQKQLSMRLNVVYAATGPGGNVSCTMTYYLHVTESGTQYDRFSSMCS